MIHIDSTNRELSELLNSYDLTNKRLGFADSIIPNTITFADSQKYLEIAVKNSNIDLVFTESATKQSPNHFFSNKCIVVDLPYVSFHELQKCVKPRTHNIANNLDASAHLSNTAQIAEIGVKIGKNCVIGNHVVIESGTSIGDNCIIESGAKIGVNGTFVSRSRDTGLMLLDHKGGVKIENNVFIGANSVIAKAIFEDENTSVGNYTVIDSGSYISHGVHIGENNHIASGVNISGYTKIQNNNWIGPNAVISHKLNLQSNLYVTMGSMVFQDLEDGWKVVGIKIFKDKKLG